MISRVFIDRPVFAWVIALFRVLRMIVLLGGIAAFGMWLANRNKGTGSTFS